MRDNRKDEQYFSNKMNDLKELENYTLQLLAQLQEKDSVGRYRCMLFLADHNQDLFRTAYSYGMAVEDIFPFYMKWLKYVNDALREDDEDEEESLYEAVELFSIGVFYKDRREEFIEELSYLQSRIRFDDGMLNLCYTYLGLKAKNEKKSALKYLNKWLLGTDKTAPISRGSLNDWYRCNRGAVWYNAHKAANNLYTGYWSFEFGALAKILKLDDRQFQGNKNYYPYDLVHFAE